MNNDVLPYGSLIGMKLLVDPGYCQTEFVRWKRTNRKARIAKKWRKKYGPVMRCKADRAYHLGVFGLVMCPCVKRKFDQHIPTAK